jgi:hypothetical protein
LGIRLQIANGTDPQGGAWTFDAFRLTTDNQCTGNQCNATVPEPTSTLSLLALRTLGAVSTLKRKLKPSQFTEKETTKVG